MNQRIAIATVTACLTLYAAGPAAHAEALLTEIA